MDSLLKTREKKMNGVSYSKRIREVNDIYNQHSRKGLSNRFIWKKYIYPSFGICERTFYNYLKRDC